MINFRISPNGEVLHNNASVDPSDVIDLVVNYTQFYKSDTITTITVTGTNVTIDSSAVTSNVVTIWISSAVVDCAEVKIKTESVTRTIERTLFIPVKEK